MFRKLYDRLTMKYPRICTLSDDLDGVWSDGPLWNDLGDRAAVLGVVYSRVEEVLPFLLKTANDLGLVVFEWAVPWVLGIKMLILFFKFVTLPACGGSRGGKVSLRFFSGRAEPAWGSRACRIYPE